MTEATAARTWTLELPAGTEILTANNRLNRYAVNSINKALRKLVADLALAEKLPVIGPAYVLVEYLPPPRRRKDRHPFASARVEDHDALYPTGKALVDGLAAYGTFGGADSKKRVLGSDCRVLPQTHPRGLVRIHLTEVAG
jgi:hypothetical protein